MSSRFAALKIAVACCLLVATSAADADIVQYELTFTATWSTETHPDAIPAGAHFSPLVGLTHNSEYALWNPGEPASTGMENVAETGSTSAAKTEMAAAIAAGTGYEQFGTSGLGRVPLAISTSFDANSTHPLVSFASMIAPSPDWFVGGSHVLLKEEGHWIPEIRLDMINWDAGTEDGIGFSTSNPATNPPTPISEITGAPFENTPPLGFFLLELASTPGDFDDDNELGAGDVEALCASFGTSNPAIELTGDDQIDEQDLAFLVEELMETRLGDSNLDGNVDFDDFLAVSADFGEAATWASGDFNCSGDSTFPDFLLLSRNFGFSRTGSDGMAVSSVPEPTGLSLLSACLLLAGRCRTRRRVG